MYIELSYPFDPTAAVVDEGIQPPQVVARSRMADGKRNNTSYIKMFAHSGTHIDVPWHFNPQGKKINDFPIDAFAFEKIQKEFLLRFFQRTLDLQKILHQIYSFWYF